jgi:xylitol oxidase
MSVAGGTWSGAYQFSAPRLVEATSVDEVQKLVAAGGPVRALGTRHSFNDLADTDGTLVTVTNIESNIQIDQGTQTVTVGAGTPYGELTVRLGEDGWGLPNVGSLPHISVGGAIATGTHGSGDSNRTLASAVSALDFVDAHGELVTIARGQDDFSALPVGLGAFGVVVRVTLELEPSYLVRQDFYDGLEWRTVLEDFDAVTSGGYSVSLFIEDWHSETFGRALVKRRTDRDDAPEQWLGARLRALVEPSRGASEANTTPYGVLLPWYKTLPHFRVDTRPSFGDEIQSEWFVGRESAPAAIAAIREIGDLIAPALLISEIRTVASDGLWLSEAYERESVALQFTWRNDGAAVRQASQLVEQAIEPFQARPHWGKVHNLDAAAVARVVPRAADARAVFERLDPEGIFANAALRRLGLRESR